MDMSVLPKLVCSRDCSRNQRSGERDTLLDHFGVGLLDENSDPSERLAPPITQLLDSRIAQLRGRVSSFSFLDAALRLLHGCCRSPVTRGAGAVRPPAEPDPASNLAEVVAIELLH